LTFTTIASKYMIGYTDSNGRVCHAFTSSNTASVILEIVSWLSAVPRVRSKCA
jgi:hypothetical protein